MDEYLIPPNQLLAGIAEDEKTALLKCLKARVRHYGKGENLLREQEPVDRLGIILIGSVEATKLDISGKRLIISRPGRGSVFGDVLSLHPERRSPVTVTALEKVSALLIPTAGLLSQCQKRCAGHDKLIHNLLRSVAGKYFQLHDRIQCITRTTVREKVMSYLENAAVGAGSGYHGAVFRIPYNRASMADYLNVERSALSRELSAMKRDGLIDYHKNAFRLL